MDEMGAENLEQLEAKETCLTIAMSFFGCECCETDLQLGTICFRLQKHPNECHPFWISLNSSPVWTILS